jgi:hypothetical protein
MKTPDGLSTAIENAVIANFLDRDINPNDLNEEEDIEFDDLVEEVSKKANKWFQYGECITVELDTDNDTCVVLRR